MYRRWSGFVALLLLGCVACESAPPDELNVRFMPTDRARIDTLVSHRLPALREEMDSLCQVNRPALLDRLTDSIVRDRLREELRLRERIQRQIGE
jgi:hypothetical protein